MKNLLLCFFVISFLGSAYGSITIVSDLDDTIKITNSGREVDSTYNALFTENVFTAIPEFLDSARAYTDELHVVSASPTVIRAKILSTLAKKKIKIDSLTLRNFLRGESKLIYKVRAIKAIMDQSGDDFIFLGDDVGQDPEVYDELMKLYPNRVLASYIHVVNGRKLPESVIPYFTTFDLYLREYMAGRMTKAAVEKGVSVFKAETNPKLIIPDFAQCPKTPAVWYWQAPTIFVSDAMALAAKINRYCLATRSGN